MLSVRPVLTATKSTTADNASPTTTLAANGQAQVLTSRVAQHVHDDGEGQRTGRQQIAQFLAVLGAPQTGVQGEQ